MARSQGEIIIELDEGWNFVETGITKLKLILEGLPDVQFSSAESVTLYTVIYSMCVQKAPHDYSQQLYEKYQQSFDDYINSMVLPLLRDKHDEFMLRELIKRWTNHKIMVKWLSYFFQYLDRYFILRRSLPPLKDVGLASFRDLVYKEFKCKAGDVIITLIDQEREGKRIDRALLKNVLDMFVEIGKGQMYYYENDFENAMLNDTAAYYSRKASDWIVEDSCPDYMLKAEECLKKEKDRCSHYLHSSSETKLLEKVQNQLLVPYTKQLLEKEHSGCRALLRDDKVEDLSRMYRLFHKIPKGLEHIANIFKQHVSSEGMVLIQQAEVAMSNKAEKTGGAQELALVTKLIELHNKYFAYVNGCFSNDSLFDKALKEAFEALCNKVVGGTLSAELLASYCNDILQKGGAENGEKLSDEATEETLDKVVNVLTDLALAKKSHE